MTTSAVAPLERPGKGRGLLDVMRHRYLLRLLVKKETQLRYRGSLLGWAWSYIKPAAQFAVFYLAIGEFLGGNKSMPNFAVYLFSGLILVNFFSEGFDNATRSIVNNSALVKKIYLPRELFPVSSVIVAFVNFLPQLVILLIASFFVGWHPNLYQLAALVLAMATIALFAVGLGLIFCAVNVGLRDAQSVVEVIVLFTMWLSPVFYHIEQVQESLPGWAFTIYQLNPITAAVGAIHFGVWYPTTDESQQWLQLVGPGALSYTFIGLLVSCIVLVIGQLLFKHLEQNFAQEL